MFPNTNDTSNLETTTGTKSFLFDFENNEFVIVDGKLVEYDGLEAIKVWISKILKTEKGRYEIYDDTDYGIKLEDLLIGSTYSSAFIEAELKREIEDALLQNPQITAVTNFNITRDSSRLTVEMEVDINDAGTNTITVTV